MAKHPESPPQPTVAQMRALCARAGVLPEEMREYPEVGLLLSPSGVRKLAALAPDKAGKMNLLALVAEVEANPGR